jgi:hypothetical protein
MSVFERFLFSTCCLVVLTLSAMTLNALALLH